MAKRNRFGLTRQIPESVKLQVRQRCGFGCVICGASIVDYHHVEPPYVDAERHDPDGIALLCGRHHSEATRGFLSSATVGSASAAPKCLSTGFSWGALDFGAEAPVITLTGVTLRNCPVPITVDGIPLIQVEGPEKAGGPFRLSAQFFDSRGRPVCTIIRNEWSAGSRSWDATFSAGRIEFRSAAAGPACLILVAQPQTGLLIERIDMLVRGRRLRGEGDTLRVIGQFGGGPTLTRVAVDNSPVGIAI